jgi:hypothetical protein
VIPAQETSRRMPKWLQGMLAPTLMLWLYAAAYGVACGMRDGMLPTSADYVARIALALIVSSWVIADARKRQRHVFYDYDSLIFFAWPVVVPVYLFRTRGFRALLTLLCFAGIWLVALLAAAVILLIREFLLS